MTWLDVLLLAALVAFLAMGARLGSVWIAACVGGGFAGAFLADVYAHSFAGFLAPAPAPALLAGILLFSAGVGAFLLPGWFLSRVIHGIFLGVADGIVGFATGGVIGVAAIVLVLLLAVPTFPSIERSRAWKESLAARRLYAAAEAVLSGERGLASFRPEIPNPSALAPVARAREIADDASQRLRERIVEP